MLRYVFRTEPTDVTLKTKGTDEVIKPNPGSNVVNLDFNLKESGLYSLKITNYTGNIVKQQNLGYLESGSNDLTIQISDLIPGAYYINMTNGKQTNNFKFFEGVK